MKRLLYIMMALIFAFAIGCSSDTKPEQTSTTEQATWGAAWNEVQNGTNSYVNLAVYSDQTVYSQVYMVAVNPTNRRLYLQVVGIDGKTVFQARSWTEIPGQSDTTRVNTYSTPTFVWYANDLYIFTSNYNTNYVQYTKLVRNIGNPNTYVFPGTPVWQQLPALGSASIATIGKHLDSTTYWAIVVDANAQLKYSFSQSPLSWSGLYKVAVTITDIQTIKKVSFDSYKWTPTSYLRPMIVVERYAVGYYSSRWDPTLKNNCNSTFTPTEQCWENWVSIPTPTGLNNGVNSAITSEHFYTLPNEEHCQFMTWETNGSYLKENYQRCSTANTGGNYNTFTAWQNLGSSYMGVITELEIPVTSNGTNNINHQKWMYEKTLLFGAYDLMVRSGPSDSL